MKNLSFKLISAKDISLLLSEHKNENILIFASGSLQYVQPEHLEMFFNSLNKFSAKVILVETGNNNQGAPDGLKGSLWRVNFSYTHDYKYYAEKRGIKTVKSEIIKPYFPYDDFPRHKHTIHYFYSGKTNSCNW